MITAEYIRSILDYDPEGGVFRWRYRDDVSLKWNIRYPGTIAGYADNRYGGRISISINKRDFFAHRLAFLYMSGRWPKSEIDHRDGEPSNNRWSNLREATSQQNKRNKRIQSNNKCGLKGVTWKADRSKWRAVIRVENHHLHLGYFPTANEAYAAYCEAAQKYHAEFARMG